MSKPSLQVPAAFHEQLKEDLADVLELLSKSFDVIEWSESTPSSARTAAEAAESAMRGLEVSTAIDCPFIPFVLVGDEPEGLTSTVPDYPSPLHMVSATAYGDLKDYYPGQEGKIQEALDVLSKFGKPRALTVDGGGMGEVRLTSARGQDGVSCGLFTILLE